MRKRRKLEPCHRVIYIEKEWCENRNTVGAMAFFTVRYWIIELTREFHRRAARGVCKNSGNRFA